MSVESSVNIGTIYEEVEDAAVPDIQNEYSNDNIE